MVYLFVGQEATAKEAELKKIKSEFLPQKLASFNLDIIYARETKLKLIQEKFLCLPAGGQNRLIVLKDAQSLDEECKDYIARYVQSPYKQLILIIDFDHYDAKDEFLKVLSKHAKVIRFKENISPDTFTLCRQVNSKDVSAALQTLNSLLDEGERPERILGGLRYVWERQNEGGSLTKNKFQMLLNCDIDIKTGRLKPACALEKLIVALCALV